MQALWISLRENVNCGSKLSNVVILPEKCNGKRKTSVSHKDNQLIRRTRKSFGDVIKGYNSRTRYCEIRIGDPARNITEIIFHKASTNPSRKIKKVLKVKHSFENLERFEKYREKVKENAYTQQKTHPRSTVDGNELLRFYGTTITCCPEESTQQISELCRDPTCQVCRLIQSNFDTEQAKKSGIRFSTNSEDLSENVINLSMERMERAVIVCRIIAGSESYCSKSESLVVRNPSAVLPCFVIVFT